MLTTHWSSLLVLLRDTCLAGQSRSSDHVKITEVLPVCHDKRPAAGGEHLPVGIDHDQQGAALVGGRPGRAHTPSMLCVVHIRCGHHPGCVIQHHLHPHRHSAMHPAGGVCVVIQASDRKAVGEHTCMASTCMLKHRLTVKCAAARHSSSRAWLVPSTKAPKTAIEVVLVLADTADTCRQRRLLVADACSSLGWWAGGLVGWRLCCMPLLSAAFLLPAHSGRSAHLLAGQAVDQRGLARIRHPQDPNRGHALVTCMPHWPCNHSSLDGSLCSTLGVHMSTVKLPSMNQLCQCTSCTSSNWAAHLLQASRHGVAPSHPRRPRRLAEAFRAPECPTARASSLAT